MPFPSFHDWLRNRADEAPAAENLVTIIASAGVGGVSLERLRALVPLSPETLQDVLKALVATGQLTILKIGGQFVYRTTT